MTNSLFHSLDSEDAFEDALKRSTEEPIVLFKHSIVCPISALAHRQVKMLKQPGDAPVYRLVVQKSRAVSDTIAERFGIRHESPQAIVVYDQQPIFNASHTRITADAIREVITRVTA